MYSVQHTTYLTVLYTRPHPPPQFQTERQQCESYRHVKFARYASRQLSLAIAVLGTGNSIMSSLVIGIVSRRQSNTSTMEHKTCTRGNLCVFSSFSASTLHALVCLAIPVTWEQSLPLITQCYLDVGQTGWWTQPNVSCRWRTVPNTFLTL